MTPQQIAEALGGAKRAGNGFNCRCPCHDDERASLNVAGDGKVLLVRCYAGCSQATVLDALRERGFMNGHDRSAFDFAMTALGKPVAIWTYLDAAGTRELLRVARYATPTGKEYRPWIPDGARWKCHAHPAPRPLYGLDLLARNASLPVLVTEGEKAADAAHDLIGSRYAVTTWPGGANAAEKGDWTPLRGRVVTLWPDADAPGAKAMQAVAAKLRGIAASITVVDTGDRSKGWDAADAKAEGWSGDDVLTMFDECARPIETPTPAAPARGVDPLPYTWGSAINTTTHLADEILEGVLTRSAMSVVYGESGCGKTYLVLDLGCRVALGLPWLGRCTQRGIVIYVAAEAGKTIQNRLFAFKREHRMEDLPIALVTVQVDLRDPLRDRDRVIETARQIKAETNEPVVLIIVDTLARAFAGGNENASEDMGSLVANSDFIREQTGAHVLWVHHTGKDLAKGARGHSLLRAASDTEIEVTNRDGIIVARITKQRDGATGDELAAKLRPINIGENAWGAPLTACVVDPLDSVPVTRTERRLPKGSELAHRALREAISEHGETMPGTSAIPPNVKAVTGTQWRQRFYVLDTLDIDSIDPAELEREKGARKKRFTRARKALLDAGLVGSTNDLHWL